MVGARDERAVMFERFRGQLNKIVQLVTVRIDRSPIADVEALETCVRTRSAYIAQTSLYGYMKTRMGTRYREYFEDDTFSRSLRIAAVKVAVACLDDLTVFAVGETCRAGGLGRDEAQALAQHCFEQGCADMLEGDDRHHVPDDALASFRLRIDAVDWETVAEGETAFVRSPRALVRFAPVVDEFMEADRGIVTNSIRFHWLHIRDQLRKRLDADAVCVDWRSRAPGPGGGPS